MKKVLFSLFFILCALFIFSAVKVSATDTGVVTITDGASVRTENPSGLRFEATVSGEFEGSAISYGFVLTRGTFTKDQVIALDVEKKVEVDCGEPNGEGKYNVTITNIPEEGYTGPVTALAYVKVDGVNRYSSAAVTRNIADVARTEYNENNNPAALVTTIAEATRVKVTHNNSTVNYYGTLAAAITATFAEGDTVELVKGTYDDALTISVDDFTLKGNIEYNLKHDDTYTSSNRDTVLEGALTITGDDFKLQNVVFSNQVKLNGADDASISHCVSTTPVTNDILYAIGTITSECKNLTVENVAVAGSVNRFVYGYGAIINGLTVNNCCVLDSVTINSGSSVGICDFIRLGQTTDNKSAGTITVSNCYIRAFQSGFTDRKAGGDVYNFINNYFYDMPNAIYSKDDSVKAGIVYNITYNTFNNCLKSNKGWDVVEIDPESNKTVNVNYNAFANTGTRDNCYSISVLSTATKDCSNNYFKGDADRVVNNVTPTDWSLEEDTTTVNTYDPYQIVQIAGHYYIYGVNLKHVDE